MKHLKIYENNITLSVSEKLSEIFFKQCENFGSEYEDVYINSVLITFYFNIIEDKEFEQIINCKKFIEKYISFHISKDNDDIIVNFTLDKKVYYTLDDK